jgi:hypothetical protein
VNRARRDQDEEAGGQGHGENGERAVGNGARVGVRVRARRERALPPRAGEKEQEEGGERSRPAISPRTRVCPTIHPGIDRGAPSGAQASAKYSLRSVSDCALAWKAA